MCNEVFTLKSLPEGEGIGSGVNPSFIEMSERESARTSRGDPILLENRQGYQSGIIPEEKARGTPRAFRVFETEEALRRGLPQLVRLQRESAGFRRGGFARVLPLYRWKQLADARRSRGHQCEPLQRLG